MIEPETDFSRFYRPGEDWRVGFARMCDYLREKYRGTYSK